jgi:hypothetical protein
MSEWTISTLHEHFTALREADKELAMERDRRYSEARESDQRALQIKEVANRDALALDRQIRDYKDEKANQLREQIGQERLLYATKQDLVASFEKIEAIVAPLVTYAANQQGAGKGRSEFYGWILAGIGLLLAVLAYFRS